MRGFGESITSAKEGPLKELQRPIYGKERTMLLDINSNGRIVIRDMTNEAWAYIEACRKNPMPYRGHWCFGKELFDGTAYITTEPEQPKKEIAKILTVLEEEFGLEMTEAAKHVFVGWVREVHYSAAIDSANEECRRTRRKIDPIKTLALYGCSNCSDLCIAEGDDRQGYCMAAGNAPLYDVMVYGQGAPDSSSLIFMQRRYYPTEGCKYFREKGEEQ